MLTLLLSLQPENILFADKEPFNPVSRIVLCDFGLCARVETAADEAAVLLQQQQQQHSTIDSSNSSASSTSGLRQLREFCGSPGFFAPEMLVEGAYNGKKADAWSLGCILLELVLGHEDFCRLWVRPGILICITHTLYYIYICMHAFIHAVM
jgi:serine/threonine protein kinase